MNGITLSEPLVRAIRRYLGTCPHDAVNALVGALEDELAGPSTEATPPAGIVKQRRRGASPSPQHPAAAGQE